MAAKVEDDLCQQMICVGLKRASVILEVVRRDVKREIGWQLIARLMYGVVVQLSRGRSQGKCVGTGSLGTTFSLDRTGRWLCQGLVLALTQSWKIVGLIKVGLSGEGGMLMETTQTGINLLIR